MVLEELVVEEYSVKSTQPLFPILPSLVCELIKQLAAFRNDVFFVSQDISAGRAGAFDYPTFLPLEKRDENGRDLSETRPSVGVS
ncbi:MAG: hypothetical protein BGN85_00315 [Alphaproteobacteria bacterium 64-11]|nr:MAG: hypothetical protein BGN85_00315 [Alphaproteobacteria bacterium 64-11]